MYVLGAVEVLDLLAPGIHIAAQSYTNNVRVIGIILLLLLYLVVFVGIQHVSRVSVVFLVCCAFGVLFIWVGVFVNAEFDSALFRANLYPADSFSFSEFAFYLRCKHERLFSRTYTPKHVY